jgi:hypothetical protein
MLSTRGTLGLSARMVRAPSCLCQSGIRSYGCEAVMCLGPVTDAPDQASTQDPGGIQTGTGLPVRLVRVSKIGATRVSFRKRYWLFVAASGCSGHSRSQRVTSGKPVSDACSPAAISEGASLSRVLRYLLRHIIKRTGSQQRK